MWTRRALLAGTAALVAPLLAEDVPTTKLQVEVTDEKGRPVNRAAVIVRFIQGRSVKRLGRKKKVQWEMRTDQQGIADMRREMTELRTELRQDIRELRMTSQRQMWTLIAVTLLVVVGGAIKLVFFASS